MNFTIHERVHVVVPFPLVGEGSRSMSIKKNG